MTVGVQRSRSRGSRLPEGAVCVTRPRFTPGPDPLGCAGRWGNPFVVGAVTPDVWPAEWAGVHVRDAAHAVELHAAYIDTRPDFLARVRTELAGKPLACWCPLGAPCHRDTLLAVANGAT